MAKIVNWMWRTLSCREENKTNLNRTESNMPTLRELRRFCLRVEAACVLVSSINQVSISVALVNCFFDFKKSTSPFRLLWMGALDFVWILFGPFQPWMKLTQLLVFKMLKPFRLLYLLFLYHMIKWYRFWSHQVHVFVCTNLSENCHILLNMTHETT